MESSMERSMWFLVYGMSSQISFPKAPNVQIDGIVAGSLLTLASMRHERTDNQKWEMIGRRSKGTWLVCLETLNPRVIRTIMSKSWC
jgi:hypothetical protein